ncbi:6-phosphogluconate dehydrogenase C-terminal domain-like protein [Punctularia strigosozonata HHB-11173 SS5]|uniref:6-phosphogluconate dehydrogenase C-terminal domain-like protein n=1 Tax=Punctularia strigosozonata (strain HHB-11173) TaxID=741275 RepID=UPI00044164BA|nr:6-phosphogluconate dehydrogenase C-terminal domain-like protein [Punctularia strigosozonata HHB-11173 SS5]EIN12100.1 6-phosphogluconate dehydrogenase C-terminal domain-like protein [Punctularia strigosozonata HHB-11173 SS5]
MTPPTLAIIGAGAMGAAMARRMTALGCTVLTDLTGRSSRTMDRAQAAGMVDRPLPDILSQKDVRWVMSVLPPGEAERFAITLKDTYSRIKGSARAEDQLRGPSLVFADCNAVNPETAKRIAALFRGTTVGFVDAGIIGGPPAPDGSYNPTIYASADPDGLSNGKEQEDSQLLDEFETLGNEWGLKVVGLRGSDVRAGDASALKMSYAGITKGLTGLLTTMILAANASSPSTATALMHELHQSQPLLLKRAVSGIPSMLPKAYRWIAEMDEISDFVAHGLTPPQGEAESGEGRVHDGLARLYERIDRSLGDVDGTVEVRTLRDFVDRARKLLENDAR